MGQTRQRHGLPSRTAGSLPDDGYPRRGRPGVLGPAPVHEPAQTAHALADPSAAGTTEILALGRLAGNSAVTGLLDGTGSARAGRAPIAVQRADEWGKEYTTRRARPGALTYEEYKAAIGSGGEADTYAPPIKDASEWGGHRVDPVALTDTELKQILLPESAADAEALAKRIDDYLPHINTAFETMGIDTVEAQADYLAHAAGESGELAALSEEIDTERPYGQFIGRGPVQVTWQSGYVQTLAYLEARADELGRLFGETPASPAPGPSARGRRSHVPRWLRAYIATLPSGSSPGSAAAVEASVTADTGAAADVAGEGATGETAAAEEPLIPPVEVSAEDAARVAAEDQKLRDQIALMRETVAAVKADPAEAANPKYAFLFSAAYMHWTKGVKGSGTIGGGGTAEKPAGDAAWTGAGPEDRWVTGRSTPWPEGSSRDMTSVHGRAAIKKATYQRGVQVLSAKMVSLEGGGG
jgi:hypothetical protein